MTETSDHFDMDALAILQDVMEDEFVDLIQVYIEDADQRVSQLKEAAADRNALQLAAQAHSFKGGCSNIAAMPLSDLCFRIEQLVQRQHWEKLDDVMLLLEQEYQKVRAILLVMN